MKREFYNDVELLAEMGLGNPHASKIIYNTYYPIISKWIINNSGDEEQAQDIFQDGLIVLYQKSKDPEFCLTCKVGTYLFAICKRLWFKKYQNKRQQNTLQVDFAEESNNWDNALADDEVDVEEFLNNEAQYERLHESLAKLGEPCLQLIKLFYIDRLSMQDIASKMQYANMDTAKVQKYKCITRLKKYFFQEK